MWKVVKDLVIGRKHAMIQSAIFNNAEYKETSQFNKYFKYFMDSITVIKESIVKVQFSNIEERCMNSTFKFRTINILKPQNTIG